MLNGDMFAFAYYDEAYRTLDAIKDVNAHFDVTIWDMCSLCQADIQPELIPDPDDGWKRGTLKYVNVVPVHDGYLICVPPKNIKEDKTMSKINYNTGAPKNYSLENASPKEIEFEKKRKELMDEAEKKILDIRKELAIELNKLETERFEQKMQIEEEARAKMWKRKYDALIKEGFSVEQAWEMTMKSFELD